MGNGEIILVAGVDYPKYKPVRKNDKSRDAKFKFYPFGSGPFRSFCETVAKRALKTDNKLRVTLFDFFEGSRETLTLDKRGKLVSSIDGNVGKLISENFRRIDISSGIPRLVAPTTEVTRKEGSQVIYFAGVGELGSDVLLTDYYTAFYTSDRQPLESSTSITDVYKYIERAGEFREHELMELHLFSHGWAGGPVFTNTIDYYERMGRGESGRDPYDKDGRAAKDFLADNLQLDEFGRAFKSGATSYVWGCVAWLFMKRLIMETIGKKQMVKDPTDQQHQFTFDGDWGLNEDRFHLALGGDSSDHQSAKKSVNDILAIVKTKLEGTYMRNLAKASKNRVIGALPGTFSDFDKKEKEYRRFGERLLHIPMGPKFGDDAKENFQAALRFYEEMLHVNFERKGEYSPKYGRGYAIYQP